MYGERYGTSTLVKSLKIIAEELYSDMDDGVPWDKLCENAKRLMEGSIVLWERMVEESE